MQQGQAAASASSSSTRGLGSAAGTSSQLPIRASLRYQGRSGSEIVISIGSAADFDSVVEELKRRIPPRQRRYEPYSKRWYIADDYEFVLYHLFDNYSPFRASVQPQPTRTIPSPLPVPTVSPTQSTQQARNIPAKNFLYGIIAFAVVAYLLSSWTSRPDQQIADAEPYSAPRAAPVTSTTAPVRAQVSPKVATRAVKAANIREGPGVNYVVIDQAAANEAVKLVGYNDSTGEVWYLLEPGGWIWSDLVAVQPANLPFVAAPAAAPMAAAQPAKPLSIRTAAATAAAPKQPSVAAQSCTGGCVAYPTWCEPAIKGNVSFNSGERIYHVPGQEYYGETVINPDYGERWFCSEEEAMDAGWRRGISDAYYRHNCYNDYNDYNRYNCYNCYNRFN